jgi:predicted nucleic acid-binding protein
MPPILIDTNLLVYLYDTGSPRKAARARRVLDHPELARSGRLSVQCLAEFLHVSTRKLDPPLSRDEALTQAGLFTRMWPVFDLTPLILLEAARGARDHGLPY